MSSHILSTVLKRSKNSLFSFQTHKFKRFCWCHEKKELFLDVKCQKKHSLQKCFTFAYESHAGTAWLGLIVLRHKWGQRQHVGVTGSYTCTRLHGVSQITHEIPGLVFCLIAARQLSQALQGTNRDKTRCHSKNFTHDGNILF